MQHSDNFLDTLHQIPAGNSIGLFAGTFDPIHMRHMDIITQSLQKVDVVIINPNDRNHKKIGIRSDIKVRKKWIKLSLEESGLSDAPIVILDDEKYRVERGKLKQLILQEGGRVSLIIGEDKNPKKYPFPLQLGKPRIDELSSSFVKRQINSGNIQGLERIIHPKLLKEILTSGHVFPKI